MLWQNKSKSSYDFPLNERCSIPNIFFKNDFEPPSFCPFHGLYLKSSMDCTALKREAYVFASSAGIPPGASTDTLPEHELVEKVFSGRIVHRPIVLAIHILSK
jgi:hypothetical protein